MFDATGARGDCRRRRLGLFAVFRRRVGIGIFVGEKKRPWGPGPGRGPRAPHEIICGPAGSG